MGQSISKEVNYGILALKYPRKDAESLLSVCATNSTSSESVSETESFSTADAKTSTSCSKNNRISEEENISSDEGSTDRTVSKPFQRSRKAGFEEENRHISHVKRQVISTSQSNYEGNFARDLKISIEEKRALVKRMIGLIAKRILENDKLMADPRVVFGASLGGAAATAADIAAGADGRFIVGRLSGVGAGGGQ